MQHSSHSVKKTGRWTSIDPSKVAFMTQFHCRVIASDTQAGPGHRLEARVLKVRNTN